MLTAHHISKSYNIQTVLKDVSFSLNQGDRVGLIGPNGCGKTTLLRILAGRERPDSGQVTCQPVDLRVGYLTQGFEPNPLLSLEETIRQVTGDPDQIEAELVQLSAAIAEAPDDPVVHSAYDSALEALRVAQDRLGSAHTRLVLEALGLSNLPPDQQVHQLSGGQKTRLSLAIVLIGEPQLILLDEPTNHLDIQMLEWLESYLASFTGGLIIVSHDRVFLDRTVEHILDLNPESHTIQAYRGTYSDYLEQYLAAQEKHRAAYRDQVYEIRRMKQDIARTKQQALRVELATTSRQPGVRRYAKKVARKAISREKKLDRYLDSDERVEKPKQSWQMKLDFAELPHQSQEILYLSNLAIGYTEHQPLAEEINLHIRAGERIVLTGPNGAGKTTLLRTISGALPPLAGSVHLGASVKPGYLSQEGELLDPLISPVETIQHLAPLNETDARSFLHFFLFSGDDALRPSRNLSFGERARLALATLVVQGCTFLLLDEPINHLDIPSRTRFEQALAQFDGTVMAVVHDRYFISQFATKVWYLENHRITSTSV